MRRQEVCVCVWEGGVDRMMVLSVAAIMPG